MGEIIRIYKNKRTGELKGKCSPGYGIITNIVYDSETRIIYYNDVNGRTMNLCPYISENGKYCRFIDNQIVEIN